MTKGLLLIFLFLVFIVSAIMMILILKYIDPYTANWIVIFAFFASFILGITTFLALVFYFIKKVHYRGEVLTTHLSSSFRQGLFIAIFFVWFGIFERIWVPLLFTALLFSALLIFLELFIQSIFPN